MTPELIAIAFDFDRDLTKIWELQIPTEEINIKELEWHLDLPFFWQEDKPFSLKPRDALNNPEHIKRIMEVDTSYPIDIIWWKGRWQILDGLHRLCKLKLCGETIIRIRKHQKI